jgi:elongation factor Ts
MAEINANLIKELREKSGAGMMDCKKALSETNGNLEEAQDWLRKKGLATATKKSERVTAEGLVAVATNDSKAVVVEINSETDFVARNIQFQNFVRNIAKIALSTNEDLDNLKKAPYGNGKLVEEELVSLISTIGENITLRRVKQLNVKGKIYSYVHNSIADGLGKIGVLISLDSNPVDENLGKQLAMHIAANQPKSLSIESLDQSLVEREKDVQRELAKQSGKPDDIIEKMLVGRIAKFYQEVCLLEQPFVMDPDKKIADILKANKTNIVEFTYYILGEGIEKQIVDFAEEVAKVVG